MLLISRNLKHTVSKQLKLLIEYLDAWWNGSYVAGQATLDLEELHYMHDVEKLTEDKYDKPVGLMVNCIYEW